MALGSAALTRYASYVAFAGRTFLLRRTQPYLFILVLNDRCNLNCFYCESKNTGRYDLDAIRALAALNGARARGHRALVFTGGEPMLWRDGDLTIADIVSHARKIGFLDIAVFTNGTFPLSVPGCTYIVTIDGTRDIHNAIRNHTYDRILDHVRAARTKVIASMTISRTNETHLETAVEEIAATGVFAGITFNLLTHRPEVVAQHGFLGPERKALLDRLWRLKKQGFPIVLSKSAYKAMRANNWKRPVRQIELAAAGELFVCCRDVGRPEVCRNCGYTSCVEIAQALRGRPGAILELLKSA